MAQSGKPKGQEPLAIPKNESEYKELKRKFSSTDNVTILKLTRLSFQAYRLGARDGINKRFMDVCLDECLRRGINPLLR